MDACLCMRMYIGLREVELYDAQGTRNRDYAFASLTVHIEIEPVYVV
jgi:hypothetical protein